MLARATLLAALAALLLAAPRPAAAQAASAPVDLRVNSLRVWLNTMEQVGAAVNTYTSKDGQPPTQTNFAVNRVLSPTVAGTMEAEAGQVADIAVSSAFSQQELESGYSKPLVQAPIGFGLSEVYYHYTSLTNDVLRLDACAIAGILQGNTTSWISPEIAELNAEPPLPLFDDPLTLVWLNASFSGHQSLSYYLSTECPEGWPHGVVNNFAEIVADVPGAIAVTDIQQGWDTVNKVRGAMGIGVAAPFGEYQEKYPNALQIAALRAPDGRFVEPTSGDILPAAIKELAAAPELQGWQPDWPFLAQRSPVAYPVVYWGFAMLAADVSGEGARGLYVLDSAAFMLTDQGQAVIANSTRYPLPAELKPAALRQLAKVKTASDTGVTTGIPVPELPALPPPPAGAEAAAAPPPSGARSSAAAAGSVLLAALVAAALLLV